MLKLESRDDEEYGRLFPEQAEFNAWVEAMEEHDLNVINLLATEAAEADREVEYANYS